MSVDASQFKNALKLWASGVTVVTAHSDLEGPKGMTVTAFSSVSAEPAQILVCLNQSADTGALIQEQGKFAVNILNSDQQTVSNQFAGGSSQEERFAQVNWQLGELGVPVLSDALASLECKVVEAVKAGSHWIVIGEVQTVTSQDGSPLLYFNSAYRALV